MNVDRVLLVMVFAIIFTAILIMYFASKIGLVVLPHPSSFPKIHIKLPFP